MQKGLLFSSCLLALAASTTATLPPGMTWMDFITKPVYARSLGPPGVPAMSTISVPYMPKSSPFFPKFVDPKTMIAKKTDMLSNMFAGMGPVMYPPMYPPMYPYPGMPMGAKQTYGMKRDVPLEESVEKLIEPKAEATEEKVEEMKEVKRGAFGPMGPSFGPMGMKGSSKFGPMGSKFSSKYASPYASPSFYDKSAWARKRRSAETMLEASKPELKNMGPPPAYPGLTTIPEESEADMSEQLTGAPKEYMPGMFGPFGPFGPVVDPSMYIQKKTAFLDQLFKNLATTTPGPFDPFAPKSTIVPPSFWIPPPFAAAAAAAQEKTPSAS